MNYIVNPKLRPAPLSDNYKVLFVIFIWFDNHLEKGLDVLSDFQNMLLFAYLKVGSATQLMFKSEKTIIGVSLISDHVYLLSVILIMQPLMAVFAEVSLKLIIS